MGQCRRRGARVKVGKEALEGFRGEHALPGPPPLAEGVPRVRHLPISFRLTSGDAEAASQAEAVAASCFCLVKHVSKDASSHAVQYVHHLVLDERLPSCANPQQSHNAKILKRSFQPQSKI